MRQWLSTMRFWIVSRSDGGVPSTLRTSQSRAACEVMLRRTSWNSSFMRPEMRLRSCRWVTSRPSALATGPSTWASAARTGCAESMPSDWNCGRTCCCSWSLVRGRGSCKHCSTTRTASLRTSCSLSFMSCTSGATRSADTTSGPAASHSWSKIFATASRTRHERSSAASWMTETVCCRFSSGLSILEMTSVAWTHETRIVS
mmetsp:Transcript_83720/g.218633  ORF Transcript_83720/g.218633 Transcript_83720/m.218633 type:complete len:202 (-) Transcript_83720:659-1264(-)